MTLSEELQRGRKVHSWSALRFQRRLRECHRGMSTLGCFCKQRSIKYWRSSLGDRAYGQTISWKKSSKGPTGKFLGPIRITLTSKGVGGQHDWLKSMVCRACSIGTLCLKSASSFNCAAEILTRCEEYRDHARCSEPQVDCSNHRTLANCPCK